VTHPTDQLAAFVDGTLSPSARTVVVRHLSSCAICRREVALAAEARDALRSMPGPLSVPDDLAEPALDELRRAADRRNEQPRWTRAVPWLAAAALIGLLAVTLPTIGSSENDAAPQAAGDATAQLSPSSLRLEVVDTDYDATTIADEARRFAAESTTDRAPTADSGLAAEAQTAAGSPAKILGRAKAARAMTCLETAFPDFPGTPVRLVQASFEGTPAYLAYVVEGPGAGQAPDTLSIWVASSVDCSILSLTQAAL
jgi:Putative zinc-finger